jgi:F5/8 type C domain
VRKTGYFLIILALGVVLNILSIRVVPFDSDQAIVGLMGKHILAGELPWLYYGDPYGGILEPLLVSWSFLFFGISRLSLYLIPCLFSILFIVSIYQLGRELHNWEVGLLAMLLVAVPSFSFGLYSSLAYGGYVEILWLGNIIFLITHRLAVSKRPVHLLTLFFLSLLCGIAWWTYPLSIVYLVSIFCFLVFMKKELIRKGKILTAGFGFFLGSFPFWSWNVRYRFPFLTFSRSQGNPKFYLRISRFYHQFIGIFNPFLNNELSFLAYFMAAIFLASLLFLFLKKKWLREKFPSSRGPFFLLLFFLSFCLFYLGSRFSEQNALRYLLPLYTLIPITLGIFCYFLKTIHKVISIGLMVFLLSVNIYHQYSLRHYLNQNSSLYRKQLQVEQLVFTFLNQKKIAYVYDPEYWSAAELTFNARENPVFCLPFKDRYPFYTLLADSLSKPAFVLEGRYGQSFEEMFRAMGGTYRKELFAPYRGTKGYVVYYDFKPPGNTGQEILPDRWVGKSNLNPGTEKRAFDRNRSTGWNSSSNQKPGMFFQIDLGRTYKLTRLILLCEKGKEWDFPTSYRIELSRTGRDWEETSSVKNNWAYLFWSAGRPFWKLRDGRMEINFRPWETRFIKITLTASSPHPWAIGELFVYRAAEPTITEPVPLKAMISFLFWKKMEYVYADLGLSAQITRATQGRIKCLQEDYDITHGSDYSRWGYDDTFPYFNKLKKQVDFSLAPAFIVAKENEPSFVRTLKTMKTIYSVKVFGDQFVFYDLKFPGQANKMGPNQPLEKEYWDGLHLLRSN